MDKVVGILGGGQLGRMLAAAASRLNIKVVILDTGETGPAKSIVAHSSHIDGSFKDPAHIRSLASQVEVLTVEIEHVDVHALQEVLDERKNTGRVLEVHPSPSTIRIIQDKYVQKEHLLGVGCQVAPFIQVDPTPDSIRDASVTLGLPMMLKSRKLAYDGRGNFVINNLSQAEEAIAALDNRSLYAEKMVQFEKEIAVMVVRTTTGEVISYPVVETVHKDSICSLVFAPLRSRDPTLCARAQAMAERAVKSFEGAGIFGVEMFLMKDEALYINEIAPRPHNSGHYTIEACLTSQYENHLRAILSLPLGSTALKVPSAAMLNLIGTSSSLSDLAPVTNRALTVPGASIHLYGKAECRKGRKMGHITITGDSDAEVRERLGSLFEVYPPPEQYECPSPTPGRSSRFPLVGVIMGSDSDLPVMITAARILDEIGVPFELTIVSAHRTPDRLTEYARSAASRGLAVIIAGAGGAAHLPGMVAAMTALPVIGVPVKGSSLDGVDSLHSMVQMPSGVPVATVAINNAHNAGLLAVRMLSARIPRLLDAMDAYLKSMEKEVLEKVDRIERLGWETYLTQKVHNEKWQSAED